MTKHLDTIAALATPPGRGGIAIIRVSGPDALSISQQILETELAPRVATYKPFLDQNHTTLDEGIALFFPQPHSFTGEDVLELQGHGGPIVADLILQRVIQLGARLAKPGEFSERAFLNGKLDLAQAEAIADLIDASSTQAARSAMRSLQGDFSKEIHKLLAALIHVRTYVEAAIDFSDEEIDFLTNDHVQSNLQQLIQQITTIKAKAKQGQFLREGITAVIAGVPNVGKSSLLNRLSAKDVAIVSDIPGTTRDVLREYILIDGMPMHLIDTAGLRESADKVEQIGVRRAQQEIEKADLILIVSDASQPEQTLPMHLPNHVPCIFIQNKIDLVGLDAKLERQETHSSIYLSAQNGDGIALLKQCIKQTVGYEQAPEGVYLARRRHLDALEKAASYVQQSILALNTQNAPELAAEELRLAQLSLNEITGEFGADDLLGHIFSSFCIGK